MTGIKSSSVVSFLVFALAMMKPVVSDHLSHLNIAEIVIQSSGGVDAFDHNRHDYDILLKSVLTAGLDGALSDMNSRLTVFAPNDGAFFRLAQDLGYRGYYNEPMIFDFLVGALGGLGDAVQVLTDVLLYHVAGQALSLRSVYQLSRTHRRIETLQGGAITPYRYRNNIFLADMEPDLYDPRVIQPNNLQASNGIIHTISRVLIPLDIP